MKNILIILAVIICLCCCCGLLSIWGTSNLFSTKIDTLPHSSESSENSRSSQTIYPTETPRPTATNTPLPTPTPVSVDMVLIEKTSWKTDIDGITTVTIDSVDEFIIPDHIKIKLINTVSNGFSLPKSCGFMPKSCPAYAELEISTPYGTDRVEFKLGNLFSGIQGTALKTGDTTNYQTGNYTYQITAQDITVYTEYFLLSILSEKLVVKLHINQK